MSSLTWVAAPRNKAPFGPTTLLDSLLGDLMTGGVSATVSLVSATVFLVSTTAFGGDGLFGGWDFKLFEESVNQHQTK